MAKLVYAFAEGDGKNKRLLGGKGANLHLCRGVRQRVAGSSLGRRVGRLAGGDAE